MVEREEKLKQEAKEKADAQAKAAAENPSMSLSAPKPPNPTMSVGGKDAPALPVNPRAKQPLTGPEENLVMEGEGEKPAADAKAKKTTGVGKDNKLKWSMGEISWKQLIKEIGKLFEVMQDVWKVAKQWYRERQSAPKTGPMEAANKTVVEAENQKDAAIASQVDATHKLDQAVQASATAREKVELAEKKLAEAKVQLSEATTPQDKEEMKEQVKIAEKVLKEEKKSAKEAKANVKIAKKSLAVTTELAQDRVGKHQKALTNYFKVKEKEEKKQKKAASVAEARAELDQELQAKKDADGVEIEPSPAQLDETGVELEANADDIELEVNPENPVADAENAKIASLEGEIAEMTAQKKELQEQLEAQKAEEPEPEDETEEEEFSDDEDDEPEEDEEINPDDLPAPPKPPSTVEEPAVAAIQLDPERAAAHPPSDDGMLNPGTSQFNSHQIAPQNAANSVRLSSAETAFNADKTNGNTVTPNPKQNGDSSPLVHAQTLDADRRRQAQQAVEMQREAERKQAAELATKPAETPVAESTSGERNRAASRPSRPS